jgi:2-oxoglutarate dehydrogenase complex dehydrogenase (E1) component-like enzyme
MSRSAAKQPALATSAPAQELSKLVAIQHETHELQRAFDGVQIRLKEVRARNEKLEATLKETQKYNALQDDNHALQLSLQSSERLRYRQKALIRLMQQNGWSASSSTPGHPHTSM